MYTKRLKTPTEQQQQQYGGYRILKWLTEEEWLNKGNHAFFKALQEANNKQAKRKVR